MPQKNILLLDEEESPWPSFLEEFFSDTKSLIHREQSSLAAGQYLSAKHPEIVFFKDDFLSQALIQKLKGFQTSNPAFRLFRLVTPHNTARQLESHADFEEPLSFLGFQKQLVVNLYLPPVLNVLVVDDEPEVGNVLKGYLHSRKEPSFHVRSAENGVLGLDAIKAHKPDVLVLDIKMPQMTGHEVYRRVISEGMDFPVIVYFDAVFGDEILELHKIGNPAIIEKGAPESSVDHLTHLILKMAYFA